MGPPVGLVVASRLRAASAHSGLTEGGSLAPGWQTWLGLGLGLGLG